MATKTYSQKITNAKVLIDGLKKIKSNLPAGITNDTIENLETLREKIETLNSENEGLKAESKKKTEDIKSIFIGFLFLLQILIWSFDQP